MTAAARTAAPRAARDPQLAQLHIARKELGLDEDDYRAVLDRATGKTSAADMTAAERGKALAEFRRLGWSSTTKGKGMEPRRDLRFVFVLWKLLAEAGCVTPGRPALNAWIGNPRFRAKWGEAATDVRFLTQERAHDVIEALKDMAARNGVDLEPRR